MLVCSLLVPVIMIIAGIIMMKRPPKKINSLVGYRTSSSMENQEAWKFANIHSGKLLLIFGAVAIIPTVLIMMLFYGKSDDEVSTISTVVMVFQLILLFISVIITEHVLKRNFKEENQK